MTSAIVLSSIVRDISAGMVLDNKAGPELDNEEDTTDLGPRHTGVEAMVDASKDVEASEVSSSEAQKVQFEIAR